jgi:hypothetical protein
MPQWIQQNATRANARTAGVAAAIVAVVMLAQSLLQTAFWISSNLAYLADDAPGTLYALSPGGASPVGSLVGTFGTSIVPIAVGVFLAFWIVVPIGAEHRVVGVVLRSLAASGVASGVSLVFTLVAAVGGALLPTGPYFGDSFAQSGGYPGFSAIVAGVQSVLATFVNVTPLVVLAGVLAWFWLARPRTAASGI